MLDSIIERIIAGGGEKKSIFGRQGTHPPGTGLKYRQRLLRGHRSFPSSGLALR
jgi:hypothetical protein